MIKLVVALGNPGSQYESTRHNIGQMVVNKLNFYSELRWQNKFKGLYSFKEINGEKIYFLIPQTYMNLSGESVLPLCQFYKITPPEILIIHDELDLPFGQLVLKKGGGLAGHNGLKSIAQCVGSQDFYRLRLGISRPITGQVSSWVLSPFSKDEQISLEIYLMRVAACLELILKEGFDKASASYNKKSLIS